MSAPPMCRCGERLDMPDAPPHKCWATQAAELEALREVERAARELYNALGFLHYTMHATALGEDGPHVDRVAEAEHAMCLVLAKLDEVRR